jgi:hypothetical protein
LLWWLFLHRRLRLRQRGSTEVERLCYYKADQFLVARPVFIRALSESPEGLSPASLSASTWGVNSNFSPPAVALKSARHRTICRSPRWSRLP